MRPIYDEHRVWESSTEVMPEQNPSLFMTARAIDAGELRSRLNEYRACEGNWASPWEEGQVDVLTTDFLNWDRWER